MKFRKYTLFVAAGAALGSAAVAGPIEVIYSNIPGHPTAQVPGLPGTEFATGQSTRFDRPFLSPDFTRFVMAVQIGSAADDAVIVGTIAAPSAASISLREGQAAAFDGSITYTLFRTQMGINNNGDYVVNGDTTAATGADDFVLRWDNTAAAFELVAREGDPVPPLTGLGWGSTNNASHILDDGTVRFRSTSLKNDTTKTVLADDDGASLLGNTDVTVPAGQLVGPDQSVDAWNTDRFLSTDDGSRWMAVGDLNGPTGTDLFMLVDGAVVAQEGVVLPGSGFTQPVFNFTGDAGSQQLAKVSGDYMFRGANNDGSGGAGDDWVVFNGVVVARTDAPIVPTATELFDDAPFSTTFFVNTLNNCGDYVIGGTTNNPDATDNAVLVFNGKVVIVREGAPVDLNGNGIDDDDTYIKTFNNDDSVLTNDRVYYFNADLKDSAAVDKGQAFLRIQIGACPADFDASGFVDTDDFDAYVQAFEAGGCNADFDRSGFTDTDDFDAFVRAFELGC